jgi:hypothetical protein
MTKCTAPLTQGCRCEFVDTDSPIVRRLIELGLWSGPAIRLAYLAQDHAGYAAMSRAIAKVQQFQRENPEQFMDMRTLGNGIRHNVAGPEIERVLYAAYRRARSNPEAFDKPYPRLEAPPGLRGRR